MVEQAVEQAVTYWNRMNKKNEKNLTFSTSIPPCAVEQVPLWEFKYNFDYESGDSVV